MKLTTKGRYAVTAMLDLALHANDGPVALAEISERQELSLSYLEQLFAKLRKKNLVKSTRGPGGGYRVAKPLSQVAVAQIIFAVDESVDATSCAGRQDCLSQGRCLTHDLWESLSEQIEEFLQNVSLQDLIDQHAERTGDSIVLLSQEQVVVRQHLVNNKQRSIGGIGSHGIASGIMAKG